MKIGVIGSGLVGQTLAAGFLKHGHEVTLGSREPGKLADWRAAHAPAKTGAFAEAAGFGEVIVLAVAGEAALAALKLAGAEALDGKVVIDACNPIGGGPPVHGVLHFFTTMTDSLMERLQSAFPKARFVKAFNSVGAAQMINPVFAGGRPTMFICGGDAGAKKIVAGLLDQLGWDSEDMGEVEAARAIEPLCMLWCIPGIARGDWSPHAFKLSALAGFEQTRDIEPVRRRAQRVEPQSRPQRGGECGKRRQAGAGRHRRGVERQEIVVRLQELGDAILVLRLQHRAGDVDEPAARLYESPALAQVFPSDP